MNFLKRKHVFGILGVLVLVAGLSTGVALVQQQQDIGERASCKPDHGSCQSNSECCSGLCQGVTTQGGFCVGGCKTVGQSCGGTSGTCCANLICNNTCEPYPLPSCLPKGSDCGSDYGIGCCAGFICVYKQGRPVGQCKKQGGGGSPPSSPPNQSPPASQPPKSPDGLCSNQSGSWGAPECNKKEEGTPCEEDGMVCTKKKKIKGKDGRLICTCKPGGSPSPSPSGSPSPTPSASPGTGLNIRFRWRGITTARPAQVFVVTFKKDGAEVKKLTDVQAVANDNGVFTAVIDTTGYCHATDKFDILIKGSSTLAKKFPNLGIPCGTLVIDRSQNEDDELLAGDVNNDNLITVEDLAKILSYYTTFAVPVRSDEMKPSDVNKDGFITIDDVALVALNWSDFIVPGDE